MSSKAETITVIDPRINPQPGPVYAKTISPKQNQFYKIPASGLSDTYITFNNLTTLGADRAYSDSFEVELKVQISFTYDNSSPNDLYLDCSNFTFDSFPFNKCCEQVRVNINGGAFFSEPMSYLRYKERYWDSKKLNESFANTYPCNKPVLATEMASVCSVPGQIAWNGTPQEHLLAQIGRSPTRLPYYEGMCGNAYTMTGPFGSNNFDIITLGETQHIVLEHGTSGTKTFEVTWREPIFCSPFSSKYDQTYGRPLYNITSMDIAFNLVDLRNMIRSRVPAVGHFDIHIASAQLCYQVLTLPPTFTPPPFTVVPYRRFVPYITDLTGTGYDSPNTAKTIHAKSGVYTLNEVPTAIWVFMGPSKGLLQSGVTDGYIDTSGNPITSHCWNKLAFPMEHINITLANTTQMLNTATPLDLYRIAKANGCQDSFTSYYRQRLPIPANYTLPIWGTFGAGSVLRLIPGVDLVLPEQDLIPGTNAHNAVLTVEADFTIPTGVPPNMRQYALWLIFEYVGVATIRPGQCEIDMNPLGDSDLKGAPVVSTEAVVEPSTTEGAGWLDTLKDVASKVHDFAKEHKLVSKGLSFIPGVGGVLSGVANTLGYGATPQKRPRSDVSGGAKMSMRDFM